MAKFKRRAAVVEAVQWLANRGLECVKVTAPERGDITPRGILRTQFGTFIVRDGDWIVSDETGNRWVVEFGRFAELYEPATEQTVSEKIAELHKEACGARRCERCGGQMHHTRLKGYVCSHC